MNSGLVVMRRDSQEGFPEEVVVEVLKAEEMFARQTEWREGWDRAKAAGLGEV